MYRKSPIFYFFIFNVLSLSFRDVKEHIEKLQEEREEEARVKKEKEVEKRKQKVCLIYLADTALLHLIT